MYEEKDRIGIPVHVLAPFIKKSTYLDYIEIFVKGNKYANGKLLFCRNNTINFFFIDE